MLDLAASGILILGLMEQHTSFCVTLQREGWLVGWVEITYFFDKFEISLTLIKFCWNIVKRIIAQILIKFNNF